MSDQKVFFKDQEIEKEDLGSGVQRKIMCHDTDLMLVKVIFEEGAMGDPHSHPHQQASYVLRGEFEVQIGKNKMNLQKGDSFLVPTNEVHGVKCLEQGILLDTFSPRRDDFLE